MITRIDFSQNEVRKRQNTKTNIGLQPQNAQHSPSFGSVYIHDTTFERLYPLKGFLNKLFPNFQIELLMPKPPRYAPTLDDLINTKTKTPISVIITSSPLKPMYNGDLKTICSGFKQIPEMFKQETILAQVLKNNNKDLNIITDHIRWGHYLSSLFN